MSAEYKDNPWQLLMMDDAEFFIRYLQDMEFEELKNFTEKCPEFMTDFNHDETMETLKDQVYKKILKKLGI